MVDIKNLNRVKGILSAKQGAEIPKFQHGYKFAKRSGNNLIYSADGTRWFMDESLLTPFYGRLDKFQDVSTRAMTPAEGSDTVVWGHSQQNTSNIATPEASSTITQTSIPGDPKITPQTAVENAAQNQEAIRVATEQVKAKPIISEAAKAQATTGLNTPPILDINKLQNNINTSVEATTAGINVDKQQKAAKQEKWSNVGKAIGQGSAAAITAVGNAFAANQQVTDSNLTKTADATYSGIAEAAKSMGPVGEAVGAVMGIAKGAGDIIQGLGGGTDQQTKMDKWMDSAFFSWNIGMLNGFAGKNTQDFGVDQNIVAQVGSSYGGTVDSALDAAEKAGKKYGLFSTKARKKADAAINKARSQQNLMGNIADNASDQRLAAQSMGEQAGLAYSMMTSGGYDQKYTYAAKHGGLLNWEPMIELNWEPSTALEWEPQIELNWELPTFKEGGNIDINEELEWIPEFKKEEQYPKEYLQFKDSLPDNQKNTPESEYDTYLGWKLYGKPNDFETAKKLGMYTWDNSDNSWHGNTIAWDETTGVGHFLKPKHHSTIGYELDWFNKGIVTEEGGKQREMTPEERKEWEDFKAKYILVDGGDFYKYVPKNKEGGSLGDSDIPEIEETTQKNVIPEGALHKNKHHMEHAKGLTKKGIPVIDDDGEQQAEIEHSEIIFTLEVTKKLEEYYEIFYSEDSTNKEKEEAALNAGKLLVYQILENTEDRTGLIDSCKQGGSLTVKKSTDNIIEEVLEWMPTITIVIDSENEDASTKKLKKSESKSDKEMMKEAIKEVLIELLTK